MGDSSYTKPGEFKDAFVGAGSTQRRSMLSALSKLVARVGAKRSGDWRPVFEQCATIARANGATAQVALLEGLRAATEDPCVVPAIGEPVWCPWCEGVYPFRGPKDTRNALREPDAVRISEPTAVVGPFPDAWKTDRSVEETSEDARHAMLDGWRPAASSSPTVFVADVKRDAEGNPVRFSVRTSARQSQCYKCRPMAGGSPEKDAVKGHPWPHSLYQP